MKKFLAVMMAVVMAAVLSASVFAAEAPAADYNFDANAADTGLTVHGDVTFKDGAAEFGGTESWLESNVDLTSFTEITVAVRVSGLTNLSGGGQWIYDITSDAQHPGGAESYFGLYYENGNLNAEAYANGRSGDRAVHAAVDDDGFVTVVVTYSADQELSVYVDGELAGETTVLNEGQTVASMIGSSPVFQIGKCSWDNGYYADGLVIDRIAVYGSALSEDDVKTVFDAAPATGAPTTDAPTTDAPTTGAPETGKGPTAPPTGFATIALAIAAIGSGAYVVSKKRH